MKILLTPPGLAGNYIRGAVIGFAAALFGVSCLVLLVACTNLASILMARAADRRKEIALRLAVGAGRGSLVRQLLTENLVIALLGGAGGALLATWITDALAAWRPPADFPLVISAAPDGRVFLFALTVSVLTTLLFGLLPALQAARTNLAGALKNEAISERLRHWQLRDYMVATQVGLSAVLLVCSVLVVRSLQRALVAPIGYNPKGVVTATFDLNIQGYSEARGREFQRRLLDKVRSIPGIESVATVDWLPLSLNISSDNVYIEGKPIPKPTEAPDAYSFSVSTDYFRTMQTRLLMGREFDSRDKQDGTRVAVVNKAFVDQLMHGQDPIGKRFRTSPDGKPIQIVGVAEDGKYVSLAERPNAAWWGPAEIWYVPSGALVARTNLDPTQALRLIQGAVRDLDPSASALQCGDAGRANGPAPVPGAHGGVGAGRIRRACADPGGHWHLRRDGLCHIAPHARDRHPHGDRREPGPGARHRGAPRACADRIGNFSGNGRGVGCRTVPGKDSLRHPAHRSADSGDRAGNDAGNRGAGLLDPSPAGDPD